MTLHFHWSANWSRDPRTSVRTATVRLLPEFLLLPADLLGLCFQLPLSLLLFPGRPAELLKAVAGGAHQGGRRGLRPLRQAGPRTHVLQFGVLQEDIGLWISPEASELLDPSPFLFTLT